MPWRRHVVTTTTARRAWTAAARIDYLDEPPTEAVVCSALIALIALIAR